jgi:hypothetical protein
MKTGWTKIEFGAGDNSKRARRMTPYIARSEKNPEHVYLMIPDAFVTHEKVDIYHNGLGKIALSFSASGDYRASLPNGKGHVVRIAFPSSLRDLIPIGRHDLKYKVEDGFLILDLP